MAAETFIDSPEVLTKPTGRQAEMFIDPPEVLTQPRLAERMNKAESGFWGWLRNNKDLTIEGVHIYDMITNPAYYGDRLPGSDEYKEWVISLLNQTEFYRASAEGRLERDQKWYAEGEGEEWSTRRRDLVEEKLEILERYIAQSKLDWTDDEILAAAKFAWLNGWDDNDIREFLISGELGDVGFEGELLDFDAEAVAGTLQSEQRNEIKKTFSDYLIDPSEAEIEKWAERMFLSSDGGVADLALLNDYLAQEAADLYPGSAERILQGRTPLAILGSYKSVFQGVMGYEPDWKDAHRSLAIETLGRPSSAFDFATYLRGTTEYDITPGAVNNAFSTVNDLGRLMGATR